MVLATGPSAIKPPRGGPGMLSPPRTLGQNPGLGGQEVVRMPDGRL